MKKISLAPRLIQPTRKTVLLCFFAAGFLSSCSGRVRAWVSVLGVQHLKKGELDELSGVHLDSGQKTRRADARSFRCPQNRELDRGVHARLPGSRISRRTNDGGWQDIRADARFPRCLL